MISKAHDGFGVVNNHLKKIAFRYFSKQPFFNCLKLVDKYAHKIEYALN